MPYITIANSKKIVKKIDERLFSQISEAVYNKEIYFFNIKETANLKGVRELFKNIEKFLEDYYEPIIVVDTFKYLFPESQPAYHRDDTCERLTSSFQNLEVPVPI